MQQQRNNAVDMARGFTVLVMPAVHTMMLYSQPAVRNSVTGYLFGFIAEWAGATMFLFLMGFSALQSKKNLRQRWQRTVVLFVAGYLLNLVKLVIPYLSGLLPAAFFVDFGIPVHSHTWLVLLATGDILQHAAIANIIIALVLQTRQPVIITVIIILATIVLTPYLTGNNSGNFFSRLFTGRAPYTFFPVMPWLCFSLCGLLYGIILGRKDQLHHLAGAGTVLLFMGIIASMLQNNNSTDYYRMNSTALILLHTGFLPLWIWIWHIFLQSGFMPPGLRQFLSWLSKNITGIYCFHWPLIYWLLPFFGYQSLNETSSLLAVLCLTALSLGGFYLLTLLKNYFYAPNHL